MIIQDQEEFEDFYEDASEPEDTSSYALPLGTPVASGPTHFIIARDEGGMTIIPDHPVVRQFLTLQFRQMIKERGRTRIETLREPMYSTTSAQGRAALFSHQGFWESLRAHLVKNRHTVEIYDMRPRILPQPHIPAAMGGLMPYQRPWVLRALMNGNSGLLGAPTRYGKSYGMTAIARAYPDSTIVVTAPGIDLCEQLLDHFREHIPHRDIRGVFTGSRNHTQSRDITVCSFDSLCKMDPGMTDVVMIDEPHAGVSDKRFYEISRFVRARKYGFGATLNGRFDKKDRLIEGMIGPIISNVTYREAIAQRAIAPLKVLFIKVPFSKDTVPGKMVDREIVYQRLLTESARMGAIVKTLVEEVIPKDWQTMSFIRNERQAEFFLEKSMPEEGTIAMAKRMTPKERKIVTGNIANGSILRVLASNIYVQGLTFPDLKVVINLAGGGANTTAIQKPGRLLQLRPGKNYGVMIDFIFECKDAHLEMRKSPPYNGIIGEGWARHKAYTDIGYDIHFFSGIEDARKLILGSYDS